MLKNYKILSVLCSLCLMWSTVAWAGEWTLNNFIYKPALGAKGATEKNTFDAGLDLVDAHLGKYKTLGDPGYETLAAALSTIGSTPVSLVIPAGTVNISANTTIPANVHLVVQRGGIFNIADGVTLTVNGPLTAGPYQIFAWSGTGTIAGNPRIHHTLPEWFGAVGNGSTDDYAAIEKCLTVAQTWAVPVKFRPVVYKINTKLTPIDISKTRLHGTPGTKFDFTGLTTSGIDNFAIQLYSTVGYSDGINNRISAMADIMLIGAWSAGAMKDHVGLCVGHATYASNSQFMIDRVVFQGFKYGIRLIQNAWLLTFNDCMLRWGAMYVASGLNNMGSKLLFKNFFFESGAGEITQIGTGDYHFDDCFFDNHWVNITGDVSAYFTRCSWENSGSATTSGYWLEISSTNGYVLMEGNKIYFNNPGNNYTTALFKVSNDCVYRGLHIRDLFIGNPWSWYTPEVTDIRRTLVAGRGRVTVEGVNAWQEGGRIVPIAYYPNAVYNGGFETGNLNGWSYGGSGAVSVDTNTRKVGSYSAKLVCAAGQNAYLVQEFRVRPGQMVLGTLWYKQSLTTGSSSIGLTFYNEHGQVVTNDELHGDQSDWQLYSTTFDWAVVQLRSFVPRGAVKCRLEINNSSTTGTTTTYIDDVVINVI